MCVCYNIGELMAELGIHHITTEWHLFLDCSKSSLKATSVHNGNENPSIPVAYSV